jgi:Transglutaminase-like superfamily
MPASLDFYTTPSPMTNPGSYAKQLKDLPNEIDSLCKIVQGLIIHIYWADQYGVKHTPERQAEVQLRYVTRQLDRIMELDPRPLAEARTPEKRLVGNCRDFTCMLTTMLRQHGVPARARCGFARYFDEGQYIDHWVCEYWHAVQSRWVLVDAQLDVLQCEALRIQFDPLDVPRDQFIVGGKAWQLCRSGQADPKTFGILHLHGLWFVRGDFVRDVAALNKMELLPWDAWGLGDGLTDEVAEPDLAFLDQLAELTSGDVPDFEGVRTLYIEDSRLTVPKVIQSYVLEQPIAVTLALA